MSHFCTILLVAVSSLYLQMEVGEAMGTDKLNNTARAAGFAMAWCDDAATVPSARAAVTESTTRGVVWTAASGQIPAAPIAPVKPVTLFSSWSFEGFNFWKTA